MLLLIIPVLDRVKQIRFLFCAAFQRRDDKIIRIVRIAGLHRKSSQWQRWRQNPVLSGRTRSSDPHFRYGEKSFQLCEFKQGFHVKSCNNGGNNPAFIQHAKHTD